MIIYKITNLLNGKIYIGQTIKTLEERWKGHCNPAMCSRSLIARAIQKYGKENFIIEEIDRGESLEELNKKETLHISLNDSTNKLKGYNIRFGGNNSKLNHQTKEKISLAKTGILLSQKHKANISRGWNKNSTQHFKRKIVCVNKNIIYNSITDAVEQTGISRRTICRLLKSNKSNKYGYLFRYMDKGE